jgi:hypothetical protein
LLNKPLYLNNFLTFLICNRGSHPEGNDHHTPAASSKTCRKTNGLLPVALQGGVVLIVAAVKTFLF